MQNGDTPPPGATPEELEHLRELEAERKAQNAITPGDVADLGKAGAEFGKAGIKYLRQRGVSTGAKAGEEAAEIAGGAARGAAATGRMAAGAGEKAVEVGGAAARGGAAAGRAGATAAHTGATVARAGATAARTGVRAGASAARTGGAAARMAMAELGGPEMAAVEASYEAMRLAAAPAGKVAYKIPGYHGLMQKMERETSGLKGLVRTGGPGGFVIRAQQRAFLKPAETERKGREAAIKFLRQREGIGDMLKREAGEIAKKLAKQVAKQAVKLVVRAILMNPWFWVGVGVVAFIGALIFLGFFVATYIDELNPF